MNALLVISAVWFFSELALARVLKAHTSSIDRDKSSLKVLWMTISLSITLGIFPRTSSFAIFTHHSHWIYYSGIGCIAVGLLIRWIAILTLKKSFTVNVSIASDQKIVRTEIYKQIRHPSYLGSLVSFFGLGFAFNNWLTLLIIFVPILIAFLYRIKIEEAALKDAFGEEYSDYIQHSYKFFPGIF